MADDPQHPDKLSRRELIRAAASASAMAALGVRTSPAWGGSWSAPAQQPSVFAAPSRSYPPEWTGRNVNLGKYRIGAGYPPYEPHPRYLGELTGSWHQIVRQYGERAADLILGRSPPSVEAATGTAANSPTSAGASTPPRARL